VAEFPSVNLRFSALVGAVAGFVIGAVTGCATENPNDILSGMTSGIDAFAGLAIGAIAGLTFGAVRISARWRSTRREARR
jgi:cell shape-determining protein MreD